ncbi:MAG: sigma-70 family RNA polymerase sigma factor [Verrucomicrobia bacterium]|nr:sigma-70 family RNA polymerase sigma factor [Verrucomicrobiota bacterium]
MSEDWEHLRRFRQGGDHEAFAELVRRYIDLVWAAAYRITGDADLARDVAQTVFSDLARKAHLFSENAVLAGWLHRAASFAACRAVRDETRRRMRERQAMEMQSLQHGPDAEDNLDRLLPLLDEAIARLRQSDREAIVLRYFGKKSLAEIGTLFGVSEDAAQKRLARALDRLRAHFRRRGLEASASFLAAALATAGSQAAPAGMAVAVAASSVSAGGAASATLLGQWLAHLPSSVTLMKTPVITTALVAATVSVPLVYQEYERSRLAKENAWLQAQDSELPRWREVHAHNQARLQLARELRQLERDRDELAKLRAEATDLKTRDLEQKLEWRSRLEAAQTALAAAQADTAQTQAKLLSTERIDALKELGLAARVWAQDNDGAPPPTFRDMTNELAKGTNLDLFLEPFEYVQHGRPIRGMTEPQMFLFREKQPRRLPDGKWARAYTFVDGHVEERTSAAGDFSEWERQHIAPPADK